MKRMPVILCAAILCLTLLGGCVQKENPPTVHVVHKGELYEVEDYPDVTTACALEDDADLEDCTIIPFDVMPSREGEINVHAESAQICEFEDDDRCFLVIIDGRQYIVDYR